MGKIDVFKLSYEVGDRVVIYRTAGREDIRGIVEDIGDGYILLRRPGARKPDAIFEEMISGFGDDDTPDSPQVDTAVQKPAVFEPEKPQKVAETVTEVVADPEPEREPAPEQKPEPKQEVPLKIMPPVEDTAIDKAPEQKNDEVSAESVKKIESERIDYSSELPKMELKVLGHIDLSKIDPKPKKRIRISTESLAETKPEVETVPEEQEIPGMVRLMDIVRELGISLGGAVDCLKRNGYSVAEDGNAMIPEGTVSALKDYFAGAKDVPDAVPSASLPPVGISDYPETTEPESNEEEPFPSKALDQFREYINGELEELNSRFDIGNDDLLNAVDNVANDLFQEKGKVVENAYITAVKSTYCLVEKLDGTPLKCYFSRIPDPQLLYSLKRDWTGDPVPVLIFTFALKNGQEIVNVLNGINSVSGYLSMLVQFLYDKNYVFAKLLFDNLQHNKLLKTSDKETKNDITYIKGELKSVTFTQYDLPILRLDGISNSEDSDKMAYKRLDGKIKRLVQSGDIASAVKQIDEAIDAGDLSNKYISSLLLTKAQIYSGEDDVPNACAAYRELISFNEGCGASKNNLSHLYCELARLLNLSGNNREEAIKALDMAIHYNPGNKLAADMKRLVMQAIDSSQKDTSDSDDSLIIASTSRSAAISKMLDGDIREFRFTHKEVLENNGVPTAGIAQLLYDEAVKSTDPETYPKYLEAAKAYSCLKVGSYNLQNYQYMIASYSRLKGNHLMGTIRRLLLSGSSKNLESTRTVICRLKDSAQSYYIETLDLWSYISADVFDYAGSVSKTKQNEEANEVLLEILANYLKLDVAYYYYVKGVDVDYSAIFASNFKEIFSQCISSRNTELEKVACKTIIQIGSNSIDVWNKLAGMQNGTSILYGILNTPTKRTHVYGLVNELLKSNIDSSLTPGQFFKECFQIQSAIRKNFEETAKSVQSCTLEPHSIESISEKWESMSDFWRLLSETETESKQKIDEILIILKPYLSRKEVERTNLLIQAQNKMDEQLKFIGDNTTYYGRTFFFSLLSKWRQDIKGMLDERIKRTYPVLNVQADPQYILKSDNKRIVNLLISNDGESSADKFFLEITMQAGGYNDIRRLAIDRVLAAGDRCTSQIDISDSVVAGFPSINIQIKITAYYLSNPIEPLVHNFTVENEPDGDELKIEDILWSEQHVPTEQLFVGREDIQDKLVRHYRSIDRTSPYVLYGLTRTGKSSILTYLSDKIDGSDIVSKGSTYTIVTFFIDLSEATGYMNAQDFWDHVINTCVCENKLDLFDIDANCWHFNRSHPRVKDFGILLADLQAAGLYPLFLIDEFSYIKDLIDKNIINSAFLHSLRQYSLKGLASFLYAGTYDIKYLFKDSKYGFTGALGTSRDEQIDKIDDASAERLMDVMKDKGIIFTDEAKSIIHTLSGNIPYFIQVLCKYAAYYAVEHKRRHIGFPELEHVVNILIRKEPVEPHSMVIPFPEADFYGNQVSPLDPPEVSALISSIVHFNRGQKNARGVSMEELVRMWGEHGIQSYNQKLSNALDILLEKKVLKEYTDEGKQVYKLSVDFFRLWWEIRHQDIERELSIIK